MPSNESVFYMNDYMNDYQYDHNQDQEQLAPSDYPNSKLLSTVFEARNHKYFLNFHEDTGVFSIVAC